MGFCSLNINWLGRGYLFFSIMCSLKFNKSPGKTKTTPFFALHFSRFWDHEALLSRCPLCPFISAEARNGPRGTCDAGWHLLNALVKISVNKLRRAGSSLMWSSSTCHVRATTLSFVERGKYVARLAVTSLVPNTCCRRRDSPARAARCPDVNHV